MTTSRDARIWTFLAAGAVALLGATQPARGADDLPPAIAGAGGGAPARLQRWQVAAGARMSFLRSAGFDPFSTDDVLPQFSTTVLWTLPSGGGEGEGRLTTAIGLVGELGSAGATARGADTDLSIRRGGLVIEERFAPARLQGWGYVFGRFSPGWLGVEAKLEDAASPLPLKTSFSTYSLDASLGVAAHLNAGARGVGVWLTADGGYGWSPSHQLALAPAVGAADASKAGVTSLGDLSLRGAFMRASFALTF